MFLFGQFERFPSSISRVFRIVPANQTQLDFLLELCGDESEDLDFWKAPHAISEACDLMVRGKHTNAWLWRELSTREIPHTIIIDDVDE